MAMRVEPRLTIAEQMSRNLAFRGRPLAVKFRTLAGNLLRASEAVGKSLEEIQALNLRVDGFRKRAFLPLQADQAAPVLKISNSSLITPEMIDIPGGIFKMGSAESEDELPIRQVRISAFRLGRYEVTNEEFKNYLVATGQLVPELVADPSKARHPVVNVSWQEAVHYCKWAGKRLPTKAEGEYAARGTDGRSFPWGNEWDPSKATYNPGSTTLVDAHPEGKSPFGILDLFGNVWEWRYDWYAYEDNPNDLVDPKGPKTGDHKVLHGPLNWRGACRNNALPGFRDLNIGFRVAEDLK